MKKLITLLVFALFVCINSYSQTTTRKYEYAIVQLREGMGKNKIIISYGNKREENFAEIKKIELSGNKENTDNVVDVLNYMDEQGYELISTTSVQWGNNYYEKYILRRDKK